MPAGPGAKARRAGEALGLQRGKTTGTFGSQRMAVLRLRRAGSATAARSAPAQNCPPPPVNTATASVSSASKRSKASRSKVAVAPSTALRQAGRCSVMVATGPSVCQWTAGSGLEAVVIGRPVGMGGFAVCRGGAVHAGNLRD